MTDPHRELMQEHTGVAVPHCPWRAFSDPFVGRVLDTYTWFESGQISLVAPQASKRLLDGIGFYHRAKLLTQSVQMETERKNRRARG